jgi:hypothetical protein
MAANSWRNWCSDCVLNSLGRLRTGLPLTASQGLAARLLRRLSLCTSIC